jgi:hypothetical protein
VVPDQPGPDAHPAHPTSEHYEKPVPARA